MASGAERGGGLGGALLGFAENEAVAVGEAPLTPAERTRIRELEADVRRLNMENAFLKKASSVRVS